MPRPNVAPRPVCRYYNTSRGCFAGDKCHYLHGDPSVQKYAPYEENKSCRFFSQGFCKRGRECWYKHIEPKAGESSTSAPTSISTQSSDPEQKSSADEDMACGICFEEKPALYGLLSGCSHAFCLPCIRRWRDPEGKSIDLTESGMHKTCPMCRTKSKFVVPSSLFYSHDDPRKLATIDNYRQSMSRVPCQHFAKSKPEDRFCPFGSDCFYQHLNEDGTPHVFTEGVDVMMSRRRRHNTLQGGALDADPLQIALDALEGFVGSLMQNGIEVNEHTDPIANDNVETNTEENTNGNDGESSNDNELRREVLDLHLGQMLRTMGHCFGNNGMTPSSAIDLDALFAESSSEDVEDWDDDEPFVVYTGDLNDDADDEDDGEEEADAYWDDLPTPTLLAPAHTSVLNVEEDEYEYYEAFMDGPELESESETEESELETESEDIIATLSNLSTTSCFDLADEQWNASLLCDEVTRLVDQRW